MPLVYRTPLKPKTKPGPGVMVIREHRPWKCLVLVGLTVVVMGMIGLFLYLNRWPAPTEPSQPILFNAKEPEPTEIQQQLNAFQQKNASLTAQNQELRNKLALVMRTTQVNQETYAQVLQTLEQSQHEMLELKEELVFYNRLLSSKSPSKSAAKVTVTHFTVNYDKTQKYYTYKLVLTQWAKEAKVATGVIQIHIQGQENGQTKRLAMKPKSITANSTTDSLTYKLSYFQRIKGYFPLPRGFVPEQVIIRLLPKGQTQANETRFKWEELQQ